MSTLSFNGQPFNMDLLNVIHNKVIYDNDGIGDRWDFLNEILIDNAWACGCGMPDKATDFFIRQFKALPSGIDYHTFEGGLDLFKIACHHKGFIDIEGKYTEKGEEFLTLVDYLLINDDLLKEGQLEKLPIPKLLIRGSIDDTIDKVFEGIVVSPDLSNAFLALKYIAFFTSFIKLRELEWEVQRELGTQSEVDVVSKQYYEFGETRHGEIYNAFHILENVLEVEEHGGSTPGWIDEASAEKVEAIEELFGRNDFFHIYLKG